MKLLLQTVDIQELSDSTSMLPVWRCTFIVHKHRQIGRFATQETPYLHARELDRLRREYEQQEFARINRENAEAEWDESEHVACWGMGMQAFSR